MAKKKKGPAPRRMTVSKANARAIANPRNGVMSGRMDARINARTDPAMLKKFEKQNKRRATRQANAAYRKGAGAGFRNVVALGQGRAAARARAADQAEIDRRMAARAGGDTSFSAGGITRAMNRVAKGQRAFGSGGG